MKIKEKNKAVEYQRQFKTIKKYSYDDGDTLFILKQKEIFNELVDERLDKIIDLDERINSNDLIYRYKGSTDDVNFNKFDNALDIIDKIWDGKIGLADVKYNREKFKSYLGEIKKGKKVKKNKKTLCTILKCFTIQEKRLLNFVMIILQWCLKQSLKQKLKEQDWKY